jgi:uncharacterized membrane protein
MTIRTEGRITIDAPASDVWGYLCDVARWPEWAPTVLACRVADGGPLQPGAWVEQRARDLGWNHRRREQVTAIDAPRSMAFAGTIGTSVARWGMELDAEAGGRTGTMMWVEVDTAALMRVIPGERALKGSIRRVSGIELAAIKNAVESGARTGGASP